MNLDCSPLLFAIVLLFGSGLSDRSPDFEAKILPIFQRHCLDCHGTGERQGELNLETLAGVRLGGHSGSPLLAEDLAQSELYLRVTSTTPGYRMPKTGEPLSAEELKTLAAWIQTTPATAIANEAEPASSDLAEPNDLEPEASMFPWLDALTPRQRYQAIGVSVAIILLLLYLVVRGIQTRNKMRRQETREEHQSRSRFGWLLSVLTGVMLCIAVAGFVYYYLLASQLSKQVEKLTASVAKLQPEAEVAKPIGLKNLPLPPDPMHPARLGGRYYRGNDERDPALFNGGFYRTATIDLQLSDAEGTSMQWADETSGELFVEIIIERAPEATRELFTERVREAVSLQHYNVANKIDGEVSQFEIVKEQQRWRARIALPKKQLLNDGRTEGMIYMMYGVDHAVKSATGAPTPRPHFGIRYEVELDQGRISQASTLWMGSMYTLGGRVLVPSKDQVLLDRWFDWRPIPVIEGEGSSDPELLGLPEHSQGRD